jgi:predicted Fe-S protein YdhL (DUF1289 family)
MAEDFATIVSPCVRECVIDAASGYCRGCWRTLDEISFWMRYTPEERKRVMQQLQERCAADARVTD